MTHRVIGPAFGGIRAGRVALITLGVALLTSTARSGPLEIGGLVASKVEAMKTAVHSGEWETYVTGYAWHLPHGYQPKTRARLNESTWGGGFGRTFNDEDGDRHSVYAMGFADSHRELQFNVGYSWQRYWTTTRNLSVGAGYLAFLFSREDVADRLPLPAVLPCFSLRYRAVEMIGLFVPRISRDIKGDVIFVYLRVPLNHRRRHETRGPALQR